MGELGQGECPLPESKAAHGSCAHRLEHDPDRAHPWQRPAPHELDAERDVLGLAAVTACTRGQHLVAQPLGECEHEVALGGLRGGLDEQQGVSLDVVEPKVRGHVPAQCHVEGTLGDGQPAGKAAMLGGAREQLLDGGAVVEVDDGQALGCLGGAWGANELWRAHAVERGQGVESLEAGLALARLPLGDRGARHPEPVCDLLEGE